MSSPSYPHGGQTFDSGEAFNSVLNIVKRDCAAALARAEAAEAKVVMLDAELTEASCRLADSAQRGLDRLERIEALEAERDEWAAVLDHHCNECNFCDCRHAEGLDPSPALGEP